MDTARRLYDWKHADESRGTSVRACPNRRFPTSGIEAAVHHFPSYFQGRHILEFGAGDGTLAPGLIARGLRFESYTLTDISQPRLASAVRAP